MTSTEFLASMFREHAAKTCLEGFGNNPNKVVFTPISNIGPRKLADIVGNWDACYLWLKEGFTTIAKVYYGTQVNEAPKQNRGFVAVIPDDLVFTVYVKFVDDGEQAKEAQAIAAKIWPSVWLADEIATAAGLTKYDGG